MEIVVQVRNEERDLTQSVGRLVTYLRAGFPVRTLITIADNGSSDGPWVVVVAADLGAELPEVQAVWLKQSGRGRALRSCWLGRVMTRFRRRRSGWQSIRLASGIVWLRGCQELSGRIVNPLTSSLPVAVAVSVTVMS